MTKENDSSEILTSTIHVASYELDSFGHVNNATFLNYLEKARGDFLQARGLSFHDFFKWNRFPVVIRVRADYKFPARAEDSLLVKGWITASSPISFTLTYEITNQDDRLVLSGETVHVFVDGKTNRPSRVPSEFKEKFLA